MIIKTMTWNECHFSRHYLCLKLWKLNLQFLSWIRFWSFTKNHRRIEHLRKQYETRDPPEVMQYFGLKWMGMLKILKESKTHVLVKLIFGFTEHSYSNNVHIPVQVFIINEILKKTTQNFLETHCWIC